MPKNLPEKTPGIAASESTPEDGDFTLPLSLHRDAMWFYARALESQPGQEAERYVRASVLAVFASLEAQLNMAAFGHAAAHKDEIEPLTYDVLREIETAVNEQGRIVERGRRMAFTTRLSFLTAFLSGSEFPRGGQLWQDLLAAIQIRDSLVHPKPPFRWDFPTSLARSAIDTVSEVLSEVHRLMGLDPLPWWAPADEMLTAVRRA